MSTISYTYCRECDGKLRATFFCQECGQPCCCLDCYCRHEANHAGEQQPLSDAYQSQSSSSRLEAAK